MHKISVISLLVLSFFFVRTFATPVKASGEPYVCNGAVQPSANITFSTDKARFNSNLGPGETFRVSFTISGTGADTIQNPTIKLCDESHNGIWYCSEGNFNDNSYTAVRSGNTFTATIPASILQGKTNADWTAVLRGNFAGQQQRDMCPLVDSMISTRDITTTTALVDCSQLRVSPTPITAATSQITVSYPRDAIQDGGKYLLNVWRGGAGSAYSSYFEKGTGVMSYTTNIDPATLPDNASVALDRDLGGNYQTAVCRIDLNYNQETGTVDISNPVETGEGNPQDEAYVQGFDYCSQAPAGPQREACIACIGPVQNGGEQTKVYTAFGCMGTNGEDLTKDLVRLLLGIVGGIALLSTLAAAFLLTTSQGEVSKVKSAKELITASVSGILFIIFSIMILDFIGVRILRIPGLS